MLAEFVSNPGPTNFPDVYLRRLDAAHVNYAFAIEVALKALCVLSGKSWPRKGVEGHDLVNLFGLLPDEVRTAIKAEYGSHEFINPAQRAVMEKDAGGPLNDSFDEVLAAWRLAFVKYRYRYEGHLPGGFLQIVIILETVLRYLARLDSRFDQIIAQHVQTIRPNAVPEGHHWQELEVVWVRKPGAPPLQPSSP